jgi:hypothetical protein
MGCPGHHAAPGVALPPPVRPTPHRLGRLMTGLLHERGGRNILDRERFKLKNYKLNIFSFLRIRL